MAELGISQAELARQLEMTVSGIGYAVTRGEAIARDAKYSLADGWLDNENVPIKGGAMRYDAFISYSHAADGKLAPSVQQGLHRFAKPLLRLRAMHIFRDQTSLSATPELWSTIMRALDAARFFIFMASPEAAASVWVQREVDHWLTRSPAAASGEAVKRCLIILTDGEVVWDVAAGDFDWRRTTALPERFSGVFQEEPLFVDMRAVKSEEDLSLHNAAFRNQIADLAATIHGKPKDALIGEDVRIVRRNRALAWSASATLAGLAAVASLFAYVATVQRDAAVSRGLAAAANVQLSVDPHESVRLAVDAVETDHTPEAMSALREAIMRSHLRARLRAEGRIVDARFGPSGARILGTICGADGGHDCVQALWEADTGRLICSLPRGERGGFSTGGDWIVGESGRVFTADGCVSVAVDPATVSPAAAPPPRYEFAILEDRQVIRNSESGETRSLPPHLDPVAGAAFDREGRFAVTWSASDVYMESGGGPTEIGDKTARLWGVRFADQDAVLVGHNRAINHAVFGPGFVVTGSDDRTARVWNLDGEALAVLRGQGEAIAAVDVSPDGARILTVGSGGSVWLWAPPTGAPAARSYAELFERRYGVAMPALAGREQPAEVPKLSADRSTVTALVSSTQIGVWDMGTGIRRALITEERYGWLNAWPSADGKRLLVTTGDARVFCCEDPAFVWDVDAGTLVATLDGHEGPVFGGAVSPDGALFATAGADGTVRLWDAHTYQPVRAVSVGGGRTLDVEFSHDGARFVTISRDSMGRIWRVSDGLLVHALFGHAGGVLGAAFSPDDALVVTVGSDYTRVWDVLTGKQVGDFVGSEASDLFITHDCSALVTVSDSGPRARVHDFGACGSEAALLRVAKARLWSVEGMQGGVR